MTGAAPPPRLDRWSGACLIAAGLLLVPGMLHPDIFETTLADVADDAVWVPIHVIAVGVVVLTLFGLTGLYGPRAERLGRLGAVGVVLAVIGLVMTACVAYAEAFLLPVIARDHPEVFDWNGPVTTSWAVRVTTGMALLWLVGLVLLGLSLWRSRVVPPGAALTLVGGAVAFSEPPVGLLDRPAQALARDVLEHEKEGAVVELAEVGRVHDVRVLDARRGQRLALEAGDDFRQTAHLGVKHLHREALPHVGVLGLVDRAHPALTEQLLDTVAPAQGRADQRRRTTWT